MQNDVESLIMQQLRNLQRYRKVRQFVAFIIMLSLLACGGYFLRELLPRHYTLRVADEEIVGQRHFLLRTLQEMARDNDINLRIETVKDQAEILQNLNTGKIDLAFSQSTSTALYPNLRHVATLDPEFLHILVRPDIQKIADLNGRLVNLGSRDAEFRVTASHLLKMVGLNSGIEYMESNFDAEQLLALHNEKLPDAVLLSAYLPSPLADYLIKQKNFHILDLPFAQALATRQAWASPQKIQAYLYRAQPPVPAQEINTIGIYLQLVTHQHVDTRAIAKLLEALYSSASQAKMKMQLEERDLTQAANYPLSAGSSRFLERNEPLISQQNKEKISGMLGFLASALSSILFALKWLRGEEIEK